ncbi:nickel insertion protein [Candidatus Omnitrophota bacterium]
MRYLYFDMIGGISGDMIVSSLLDIIGGGGFEHLKKELKKIDLDNYDLKLSKCQSGHISSHRFIVLDLDKEKRVFQLDSIIDKINSSHLSQKIKDDIISVYETLYKAESKIHGEAHVHFEQIGEVDSIIDIASACILIDKLGVANILYSRIPFGEKVAPATALMLKSRKIRLSKHRFENITPTGIATITTLGRQIDEQSEYSFSVEEVGYGIGSIDAKDMQNVLRVVILEKSEKFSFQVQYCKKV